MTHTSSAVRSWETAAIFAEVLDLDVAELPGLDSQAAALNA
jgi:hypothetical protein